MRAGVLGCFRSQRPSKVQFSFPLQLKTWPAEGEISLTPKPVAHASNQAP